MTVEPREREPRDLLTRQELLQHGIDVTKLSEAYASPEEQLYPIWVRIGILVAAGLISWVVLYCVGSLVQPFFSGIVASVADWYSRLF